MTTLAPPRSHVGTLSWDFEQVYEQHRERIYRHIRHLVSDQELAEDLAQETFARAFKALARMPEDLRITPWLYRIATNVSYDALRRRRLIAWQTLDGLDYEPASGAGDDPQVEYSGTAGLVRAALARMPTLYRQALLLREYEGYSLPEIAQALGIAPGGVKMHLSRARGYFRQHYSALEQELAMSEMHEAQKEGS